MENNFLDSLLENVRDQLTEFSKQITEDFTEGAYQEVEDPQVTIKYILKKL